MRVQHLTAMNDGVLTGCSGFDNHKAATPRGKWHLGFYSEFLRATGIVPPDFADLTTISSIHTISATGTLRMLPSHMMKTRRNVRDGLDSYTLTDDPNVQSALRAYIEKNPPCSIRRGTIGNQR